MERPNRTLLIVLLVAALLICCYCAVVGGVGALVPELPSVRASGRRSVLPASITRVATARPVRATPTMAATPTRAPASQLTRTPEPGAPPRALPPALLRFLAEPTNPWRKPALQALPPLRLRLGCMRA